MAGMPAASVDAVVCDPPYGLSFMGKDWDHGIPGVAFWSAALRVAKPGAHLLAFGGTRTFHRLAVAIEDAGWEIRDTVMWVYGSGFPKSHDVGKGIDKVNGEIGRMLKFTNWMRTTGLTARQLDKITDTNMGGHYLTSASQPAIPTAALWQLMRPHCGAVPAWVDELVDRIEAERAAVTTRKAADLFEAEREVAKVQKNAMSGWDMDGGTQFKDRTATAPATDAARQWDGWGTALKPAWEPIIVARKPLEGTVAANVLAHGTGALNIDGCRVGNDLITAHGGGINGTGRKYGGGSGIPAIEAGANPHTGRWPANLIHDGSDEVLAGFPAAPSCGHYTKSLTKSKTLNKGLVFTNPKMGSTRKQLNKYAGDTGSAARFFYCAKASKADRDEGCEGMEAKQYSHDGRETPIENAYQRNDSKSRNHHPTVKPTALMRYLCKLVTPPAGTVLDPFMGSGSTGKAARMEGFGFIGIEQDAEYIDIARARIAHAVQSPAQQSLHI